MTLKERLDAIWNDKPCLSPCHLNVWHLWFAEKGYKEILWNGDCLWRQKGKKIALKVKKYKYTGTPSIIYAGYGAISRFRNKP